MKTCNKQKTIIGSLLLFLQEKLLINWLPFPIQLAVRLCFVLKLFRQVKVFLILVDGEYILSVAFWIQL